MFNSLKTPTCCCTGTTAEHSVCFDSEFLNAWLHFRPTATELLKHPFFKKAKDRKYLQQTLVAIGPSLETRVQKVCIFEYKRKD
jgi:hypothetical protein